MKKELVTPTIVKNVGTLKPVIFLRQNAVDSHVAGHDYSRYATFHKTIALQGAIFHVRCELRGMTEDEKQKEKDAFLEVIGCLRASASMEEHEEIKEIFKEHAEDMRYIMEEAWPKPSEPSVIVVDPKKLEAVPDAILVVTAKEGEQVIVLS